MVAPSSNPRLLCPRVICTYLRPSAERGRTMTRRVDRQRLDVVSSLRSSRAATEPFLRTTGVIASTVPTRVPPIRTSLPTTRFAAFGTSALSW